MNRRDVTQISPRILHGITFRYVDNMEEVLAIALMPPEAEALEPERTAGGPEEPPGREIPVSAPARRRAPASTRA
jgi:hypothetical protein